MIGNKITPKSIMDALSNVQDPEIHKDLVTLNMIQDLEIVDKTVKFRLVLTTPACPLKGKIEKEAREAVFTVKGVENVEIIMDANVPSDGKSRGNLSLNAKQVIAIASGKGGVGKSTVAVKFSGLFGTIRCKSWSS